MLDISNITYEDKNLKTIEGCIIRNINQKYLKNFSHFLVKRNLKNYFNSPLAQVLLQCVQIGLATIFNKQ